MASVWVRGFWCSRGGGFVIYLPTIANASILYDANERNSNTGSFCRWENADDNDRAQHYFKGRDHDISNNLSTS